MDIRIKQRDEAEEVKEEETRKRISLSDLPLEQKACVKIVAKKQTMIKILLVLDARECSHVKEIANYVNRLGPPVTWKTVHNLLKKLEKADIVTHAITMVDRRYRYYQLNPEFPIHLIFQQYSKLVSWKLLKYISSNGTLVENLVKDEEFKKTCTEHYLSPSGGIQALKENKRKIKFQTTSPYYGQKEILFLRK